MTLLQRVTSILLLVSLVGCASLTQERPEPGDPQYAPIPPQDLMQPERVTGSIYQTQRNVNFYGDRVAYNVGDILTVVLSESTSSSKSADTTYDKDDAITFNEANVLGTNITGKNLSLLTDPSFEREFDGSASSDQSNSLTGQISVTVAQVMPNGVLRIQGEKWLKLNQGDEYIRLTGLVRPEDIGTDNTIQSAKIADARIAYGGTGEFDSANKKGWLSRFFSSEWWFL